MAQKKSVSAKTTAKTPAAKSKTGKVNSTKTKARMPAKKVAAKVAAKATRKTAAAPAKKTAVKKPAAKKTVAKKTVVAKKVVKPAAKSVAKPAATSRKTVAKKVAAKPAVAAKKGAPAKKAAAGQGLPPKAPTRRPGSAAVAAKPAVAPKTKAKAVAAAAPKPVAKQSTPVAAAPAKPVAPKKPSGQRHGFKTNEHVVYPAHGVGQIIAIEEQEIAGLSLELFVITFEKDKMTLRVPTGKFESVGMRKLAEPNVVDKAMTTLKGRARVKRTMWSRRAQEYEAKINSGDLVSIAEVVRDLYRSESQPEQSYSERQLYEQALDRMAREIAAIDKLDDRGAVQRITDVLSKSAKGRRAAEEAADAEEAAANEEADVEAA